MQARNRGGLETVKVFPSAQWAWLMLDTCSQGIFSAVKESSTKIRRVKILTAFTDGSTDDYIVSPSP